MAGYGRILACTDPLTQSQSMLGGSQAAWQLELSSVGPAAAPSQLLTQQQSQQQPPHTQQVVPLAPHVGGGLGLGPGGLFEGLTDHSQPQEAAMQAQANGNVQASPPQQPQPQQANGAPTAADVEKQRALQKAMRPFDVANTEVCVRLTQARKRCARNACCHTQFCIPASQMLVPVVFDAHCFSPDTSNQAGASSRSADVICSMLTPNSRLLICSHVLPQVANYRILYRLGEGGFATVFLAEVRVS